MTNVYETSLKIMNESGTEEDTEFLLEAAKEGALTKIKNTIIKIIEAAKKAIKNLYNKISNFFNGKNVDKAKEVIQNAINRIDKGMTTSTKE